MSVATRESVTDATQSLHQFVSIGEFVLKGVARPQEIFSAQPATLSGRLGIFRQTRQVNEESTDLCTDLDLEEQDHD